MTQDETPMMYPNTTTPEVAPAQVAQPQATAAPEAPALIESASATNATGNHAGSVPFIVTACTLVLLLLIGVGLISSVKSYLTTVTGFSLMNSSSSYNSLNRSYRYSNSNLSDYLTYLG